MLVFGDFSWGLTSHRVLVLVVSCGYTPVNTALTWGISSSRKFLLSFPPFLPAHSPVKQKSVCHLCSLLAWTEETQGNMECKEWYAECFKPSPQELLGLCSRHDKHSLLKESSGSCQTMFVKMVFSCAAWLEVAGKRSLLTAQQAAEGLCVS